MTHSAREALGDILTQLYPGLLLEDIHHGLADADHILAKLTEMGFSPPANLQTHVVVPREPTEAMFEAAMLAGEEWSDSYELELHRVWTATLAAIEGMSHSNEKNASRDLKTERGVVL